MFLFIYFKNAFESDALVPWINRFILAVWPEEDRARYEDHQERGANNWVLACDRDSPAARSLRDVILDPSEKEGEFGFSEGVWSRWKLIVACLCG